jgi:cell division protein FtsL
MEVIVGLTAACVIVAILTTHFCSYQAPKKRTEVLSRVEARYFEPTVYQQQQIELLKAEQVAEALRQKGLIDEFEDTVSEFRQ